MLFRKRTILLASLLAIIFLGSTFSMNYIVKNIPTTGDMNPSGSKDISTELEPLESFVQSVVNGQANRVVGIYIPGVIAYPVGQQPKNDAGFVTRDPRQVTQFDLASRYGTVGILAHNDLAGAAFSNIGLDQYVIVVYGDGRQDYYLIDEIQKYQALSPTSAFSNFINLDASHELLSANQLFNRVYGPGGRLVFQTCIEAFGDASWGRIFIIAEPVTDQVITIAQQTSYLLEFASFGLAYR